MTSTTSTTDNTLNLTRESLSLVVVSPDYFATGDQNILMPNGDDESRTYYATASRLMGEDWAVILVDWDTDPRGQVGWRAGEEYSDLVNPDTHGGWNIRRQYLTPVTITTDDRTPPTSAAMSQHDRVALPIEEAYPVGSRWAHTPSGTTVTVTGHRDYTVEVIRDDGLPSNGWHRPALDSFGVFVGWAEDASQEATSAPETTEETAPEVFTREDVDRLVREARETARLEADRRFEEWKERASEIACQYADDNSLCGEFERCMDELGLKGRERDYVVVFTVTVEARNEDHARERAVEDIYDRGHSSLYEIVTDIEEV